MRHQLEIVIEKEKLLTVLRNNRTKHIEEYKLAVIGFKQKCKKALEDKLEALNNEAFKDSQLNKVLYFALTPPKSMEEEYDQVIEMLEFSKNQEITLDRNQFSSWVKDDWDWKQSVGATNSFYAESIRY